MRRGWGIDGAIFRVVLLSAFIVPAATARAALSVRVVDAASVASHSTRLDVDRLRFVSDAGVELVLALDPSRLDLTNPLAGAAFVPMAAEHARAAVAELKTLPGPDLSVVVYCLPGLPLEVGRSFCRGSEVFLAPGVATVPANVVAYTLAHELGHAVQHLRLPQLRGGRWRQYLELRGLRDATLYDPTGPHRNRPQEIFAEDFRALYGGPLANYSGTIENASLPLPQQVEDLPQFFHSMLAELSKHEVQVFNAPNPFNPSTTITVVFASSTPVRDVPIQVFDLRGRRVRTLLATAAGNQLSAVWRGHDDAGRPVASGRYFYTLAVQGRVVRGSMLLIE